MDPANVALFKPRSVASELFPDDVIMIKIGKTKKVGRCRNRPLQPHALSPTKIVSKRLMMDGGADVPNLGIIDEPAKLISPTTKGREAAPLPTRRAPAVA